MIIGVSDVVRSAEPHSGLRAWQAWKSVVIAPAMGSRDYPPRLGPGPAISWNGYVGTPSSVTDFGAIPHGPRDFSFLGRQERGRLKARKKSCHDGFN